MVIVLVEAFSVWEAPVIARATGPVQCLLKGVCAYGQINVFMVGCVKGTLFFRLVDDQFIFF